MADYTLSAKIVADATDFQKKIQSAQSTLSNFASTTKSFGNGVSGIGKKLMPLTLGLGGVTAAAAKTSGNFIKLYESSMIVFSRMLGGQKAAKGLYNDLLNVAKASTFSQESFLKAGKSLVGVGVSAQNTKKYLQGIADAVTATGGSSEQLEQISRAYAKISTNGKLSLEELNMVTDANIDAVKILANQYGVSTTQMREMITSGAVPAKDALDKLTSGIENGTNGVNGYTAAMKGMAAAMKGKTLTGALDSLHSSVRSFSLGLLGMNPTLDATSVAGKESAQRIGQLTAAISTINNILPNMQKLFAGVTDGIGNLLDKLVGANTKFDDATGKWQNVNGVLGTLNQTLEKTNPDKLKAVGGVISGLALAGPVLTVAGKGISAFGGAFEGLDKVLGVARGGINQFSEGMKAFQKVTAVGKNGASSLGTAFSGLQSSTKALGPALGQAAKAMGGPFAKIGPLVQSIGGKLSGFFGTALSGLSGFAGRFTGIFSKLAAPLASFGGKIGAVFSGIASKVSGVIGAIGPALGNFGSALSGVIGQIGTFAAPFMSAFMTVFNFAAIGGLILVGLGLLQQNFGTGLNQIFADIQAKGPTLVNNFIAGLLARIPNIIAAGAQLVQNLLNTITIMAPSLITGAIAIISSLVSGLGQQLPTLIPAAVTMIVTIVQALAANIGTIIAAGLQLIAGLAQGLIQAIPVIVKALPTIITSLVTGILNHLPQIVQAGVQLIVALAAGLAQAIPIIIRALPQIISAIIQGFKSVNWGEVGSQIIAGVGKGFKDGLKGIGGKIKDAADWIKNKFKKFFHIHSPSVVMEKEIGLNLVAGIGQGIDKNVALVTDSVKALVSNVTETAGTLSVPVSVETASAGSASAPAASSPLAESGAAFNGLLPAAQAASVQTENTVTTMLSTVSADMLAAESVNAVSATAAFSPIAAQAAAITGTAKTNAQSNIQAAANWIGGKDGAGFPNQVLTSSRTAFLPIWQQASAQSLAARQTITNNLQQAINWINGKRTAMVNAGKSMIEGLNQGIRDVIRNDSPVTTMTELADKIIKKFRDALGIHSPSKEMQKIGWYMMQGLINGLSPKELMVFVNKTIDQIKSAYKNGTLDTTALASMLGPSADKYFAKWGIDVVGGSGLDGALKIFESLLDNNAHGYSQSNRWGPDFDCSSSIIYALKQAGFNVGGATTTRNMSAGLTKNGWQRMAVPKGAPKGLQRGDILLNDASHVGWWLGSKLGAFHSNYDGKPGDSSGREANRTGYYNHPWNAILRYKDSYAGSSNAKGQLADWIKQALKLTGQPMSLLDGLVRAAKAESGGNPKAVNNWDINAKLGHPSKGLFQTIDSTFSAYSLKGHKNIWNPVDNAAAAIRYMIARYGSVANVLRPRAKKWYGYAHGGIVNEPTYGVFGEAGPEALIPLSPERRKEAIGLWQEAGRQIGVLPTSSGAILSGLASVGKAGSGDTTVNNTFNETFNFYTPVQRPSETARAFKNVQKKVTYGI
jgi:tape measure domain-containing protein